MTYVRFRKITFALLCFVFLYLGFAGSAFADVATRYRQQIERFRIILEEEAAKDPKNLAEQDRADIARWLEEAEVLLAKGELGDVSKRLKRVEYGIDLIRAIGVSSSLMHQAETQEIQYHKANEEIARFLKEIAELEKKKATLTQQLKTLNN